MHDPVERLVNLALLFASSRRPVTADECRRTVAGYPEGQDDETFLRMFERDKDELRAAGLVIEATRQGEIDAYRLDAAATFAPPLSFDSEELATLRAAGAALLGDPSFPLREDLRLALLKVLPGLPAAGEAESTGQGVRERDGQTTGRDREGELATEALAAVSARKRISFDYVNARGDARRREVEPYGLFVHGGGWYLVGHDLSRQAPRVFALARASRMKANRSRRKHPDFERPPDFDVRSYLRLPFQFGGEPFPVVLRASAGAAPRLRGLVADEDVQPLPEGGVEWRTEAADPEALVRWVLQNGPGISIAEPYAVRELLSERLRKVREDHGG